MATQPPQQHNYFALAGRAEESRDYGSHVGRRKKEGGREY